MKIAVASIDGLTISHHFGRSRCFIVFDVAEGKVSGRQVRDNTFTAHAQGECTGQEQHQQDQHHSHAAVVEAMRDCQAILCYGMGWRGAEDLKANGIQPFVLTEEAMPEVAVQAYLDGKLKPAGQFCRCHE